MKKALVVGAVFVSFLLSGESLRAQEGERFSLAPLVGPTWFGHRHELVGGSVNAQPVEATLGPSSGLELGLAAELRQWERLGLIVSGSWTTVDYARVETSGDREQRNIAGDLDMIRVTAGVRYRVFPEAPGFFTAGLVVNRLQVGNPGHVREEADRTEVGGFGGLGLDFGSGARRLRVEGRAMLMAPGAESLEPRGPFSGTFEPRSAVLDFSLSLAFVFRL